MILQWCIFMLCWNKERQKYEARKYFQQFLLIDIPNRFFSETSDTISSRDMVPAKPIDFPSPSSHTPPHVPQYVSNGGQAHRLEVLYCCTTLLIPFSVSASQRIRISIIITSGDKLFSGFIFKGVIMIVIEIYIKIFRNNHSVKRHAAILQTVLKL